jgi:hypothetical protein
MSALNAAAQRVKTADDAVTLLKYQHEKGFDWSPAFETMSKRLKAATVKGSNDPFYFYSQLRDRLCVLPEPVPRELSLAILRRAVSGVAASTDTSAAVSLVAHHPRSVKRTRAARAV